MIRNKPQNRPHRKTPYHRVEVPSEIVEQIDRIATEHTSRQIPETSNAASDHSGRWVMPANTARGMQAILPERQQRPPSYEPSTSDFAGPDLNRTVLGSPETSNNTVRLTGSSSDDDAIVEAANLIAIESGTSPSRPLPSSSNFLTTATLQPGEANIRPIQLPASLAGGTQLPRHPGSGQASPSRQQGFTSFEHPTTVTRKAIVDVDQLRLDLREVFDEFLARANAVVDRHIERL